ncbi:MAG: hypothetical protein M3R07_09505 [Gemmatimonadota bacterium]|nr:hypothetical protein [Gemmatimonadota bacterium]
MTIALSMPGYAKIKVGNARGLVLETCHRALESILSKETLYEYAGRQPGVRQFQGRAPAYAANLGDGSGDIVVRHALRGGLIGRTGTDLFLPPTRGLRELVNSLRLRVAAVPTPEVVAVISYRAGPLLRRSDIATREIADSHDLSVVLREIPSGANRESCLRATGKLLASLTRAGAHHPDLNARNVLVTWDAERGAIAHVLDVDRIRFHVPGDPMVAGANLQRLVRSLNKLRGLGTIALSDSEINMVTAATSEVRRDA